jgi:hypothetical protein
MIDKVRLLHLVVAVLAMGPAAAATPPALVNYQGVLRNAQDVPQNGTFDIIFGFFDAPTGGDQILVDAHTGGGGSAVTVTDGLFSVMLGGGTVGDGSGPGTFTALDQVFVGYGSVWLETTLAGETLSPRLRVVSSPYALNAGSLGGQPAGNYVDTSPSAQTKAGSLTCNGGLEGNNSGGIGVQGIGGAAGGFFASQTGTSYAYVGSANFERYGIKAVASDAGGFFRDADNSGLAYVAYGDTGIQASGTNLGGYFSASGHSGQAYVGWGDIGLYGWGDAAGGVFQNNATNAHAGVAVGNYGVDASGQYCAPFCGAGGHFTNNPYSGAAFAAIGDTGIYADGNYQGGEFVCDGKSGHAYAGYGDFGVIGYGTPPSGLNGGGGHFRDTLTGSEAYAGQYGYGIYGIGTGAGGHFENANGTSYADLGSGATGVVGLGTDMGGHFEHFPQYVYANLAYYSGGNYYTILGNGIKSFVQNDPFDEDKVVVFAALEGDEAGTYTRGTARLADGSARVVLGPSFALVTNPDIGLTAHLTPRGAAVPLTVASVSTSELVVTGPAGQDVAFDYIVFGLRLGFEHHPPIQTRIVDSPLPPAPTPEEVAAIDPATVPIARFAAMRLANGDTTPLDLSRSEALKAAAGRGTTRTPDVEPRQQRMAPSSAPAPAPAPQGRTTDAPILRPPDRPDAPAAPAISPAGDAATAASAFPPGTAPVAVAEEVEAGDVLAIDPAVSGDRLVRARGSVTETVVGIAAGEPGTSYLESAPVALSGSIVTCRVDASRGAIRPGDLLVASETQGRARRADNPLPGTVLGRALEGLAGGTGSIRVLSRPQ